MFVLCSLLSLWSFAFAIGNSARNVESSLFWRRIAAIGWGSVYSVILHFILLLTSKKEDTNKRPLFLLLYLPALVNIYAFSLSKARAGLQYNLIKTDYGWTNIAYNNLYDWFFNLYYIFFILVALLLLWKWKENLEDEKITRQVNFVFITILISFLLGSLTDIVGLKSFGKPLTQMAPLFILLPVWSMYYSARYFDVFKVEDIKSQEQIITMEQQKKILTNLSIVILIVGIFAFIFQLFTSQIFNGEILIDALKKSLPILTIGFSILIIQGIKKEKLRQFFTIMALVSSIPIASFLFLEHSIKTTWALPIIIILSSIVFNNRALLVSSIIIGIITQIIVCISRPESYVLVSQIDYIVRIIILLVTFSIASYINKIYIDKIRENAYQIEFLKIDSDISFDFISLSQENFNKKVDNLLEKIGIFFQADRTYLFIINHENKTMTYSNEWCNSGINPELLTIEEIPLEVFPWWISQLEKNKLVYIEDVDFMPKEARSEQEQLHRQKVKSLASVPVMGNQEIQAFIGVDSVVKKRKWTEENIKLLNIMANLLASGMMQIKSDKKVEFMAYNDYLTKLPNRFLFYDRVSQAINLSKRTGEFVSVIFIDLDGFKAVNDTVGHKGGDLLLREVAQGLSKILRTTDTVARFGGDEFMIMLSNITDHRTITKIADKIMDMFSEIFTINGHEFRVTASAGISIYPQDGEDSETLIRNSDMAMYRAKYNGKDQYVFYNRDMEEESGKNLSNYFEIKRIANIANK